MLSLFVELHFCASIYCASLGSKTHDLADSEKVQGLMESVTDCLITLSVLVGI